MSFAICRVAKCGGASAIAGSQIHDRREREHSNSNPDIDFSRSHLNACLLDQTKGDGFNAYIDKQIEERYTGKRAVRKDAVRMVQLLFTSDKDFFEDKSRSEQLSFFQACLEWSKERFGAENLVSAYVHYDEETPHLHVNLIPLSRDGQHLSVRECGIGSGSVAFQQLQDDFYKAVGAPFGLDRGERADLQNGERPRRHQKMTEFKAATGYYQQQAAAADERAQAATAQAEEAEKKAKKAREEAAKERAAADKVKGAAAHLAELNDIKHRVRRSKLNGSEVVVSEKDWNCVYDGAMIAEKNRIENTRLNSDVSKLQRERDTYKGRAADRDELQRQLSAAQREIGAARRLLGPERIEAEAQRYEQEQRDKLMQQEKLRQQERQKQKQFKPQKKKGVDR